jgi:hypothetical protein
VHPIDTEKAAPVAGRGWVHFRMLQAPFLVPLKNPLIRIIGGVTFYALLPAVMILFSWKAAVFPLWGLGLLSVAVAVIVSHGMLLFNNVSRASKTILSIGAAMLVTVGAIFVSP